MLLLLIIGFYTWAQFLLRSSELRSFLIAQCVSDLCNIMLLCNIEDLKEAKQ